ncbi:MAG: symmetrical bis(5'-nucleosyl)-tetraphosphatase [Deltaproteobacteria bacterium]|nr:symmetrical bis(5'-nucleosyl)-tetraphosphatase [Deltaproteobacteria bacterium]
MSTYAIGDIQGCFVTFQRLLAKLSYDPRRDRLWLAGDLVNRGPRSLEILRWAFDHQTELVMVLGNHDLHLLARGEGLGEDKKQDTLGPILSAPDRAPLLHWLRARPLLHKEGAWVMVHAGLLPAWTVEEAEQRARRLEEMLRSPQGKELLERKGPHPDLEVESLRQNLAVYTRLRMVDQRGQARYDYDGPPEQAPKELHPWFDALDRRIGAHTILFGHWAALGHRVLPAAIALDSGCVWKNSLTAVRLEDRAVFQERYAD